MTLPVVTHVGAAARIIGSEAVHAVLHAAATTAALLVVAGFDFVRGGRAIRAAAIIARLWLPCSHRPPLPNRTMRVTAAASACRAPVARYCRRTAGLTPLRDPTPAQGLGSAYVLSHPTSSVWSLN